MRSLTLDKWEPSLLYFLISVGNERVNSGIWSATATEQQLNKPGEATDWLGREALILAKYREKKFVPPTTSTKEQLLVALHSSVAEGQLDRMFQVCCYFYPISTSLSVFLPKSQYLPRLHLCSCSIHACY